MRQKIMTNLTRACGKTQPLQSCIISDIFHRKFEACIQKKNRPKYTVDFEQHITFSVVRQWRLFFAQKRQIPVRLQWEPVVTLRYTLCVRYVFFRRQQIFLAIH